jgi:hypothetical protein
MGIGPKLSQAHKTKPAPHGETGVFVAGSGSHPGQQSRISPVLGARAV